MSKQKIGLASFAVRLHFGGDRAYGGPGMSGRKLRSKARGRVGLVESGNPGVAPTYHMGASDFAITWSMAR